MFLSERKGSGTLRAEDEEPLELYNGTYRCYASNPLGTAMTQTVKVIVERESRPQIHTYYFHNAIVDLKLTHADS